MMLTDDEIKTTADKFQWAYINDETCGKEFARAIEALLLSKLAAAEMPEPAYILGDSYNTGVAVRFSKLGYTANQLRSYGAACAARSRAAALEDAADVLEEMAKEAEEDVEPSGVIAYYRSQAQKIRALKETP